MLREEEMSQVLGCSYVLQIEAFLPKGKRETRLRKETQLQSLRKFLKFMRLIRPLPQIIKAVAISEERKLTSQAS